MSRIKRLQEWMKAEGLDGFLTCDGVHRQYLTGFASSAGWVAVGLLDATFFCDSRYITAATEQVKTCQVALTEKTFLEDFAQWVEQRNLVRIGLESGRMTVSLYEKLRERLGEERLVLFEDPLLDIRMVKDGEELSKLEQAARLADASWEALQKEIRVGRSERELSWILTQIMHDLGSEGEAFDTIFASGENGACPHAQPGQRKIQAGDLVTVDFGCQVGGYFSDMTRTIAVGTPNAQQVYWYESVLAAQTAAVDAVRPGASTKEIDALSRELLKEAGLAQYFGHSLGHGVGLEIHELPTLSTRTETLLKPGMVLTIEPGVYLPKQGGVRIEDTVVVTEDGCRRLTQSPKNLIIL